MKRAIYEAVVDAIDQQGVWDFHGCLDILAAKFPEEDADTLRSIVCQRYQKRVKTSFLRFTSESKQMDIYREYQQRARRRGESPGIINAMAKKMNFSPMLMARIVIEEWLNSSRSSSGRVSKGQVTKYAKNSSLIGDAQLSDEVFLASVNDDLYGSASEAIKHSVGVEHEQILKKKLDDLGIAYQDESHFRKMGYDKTPDIKLEVPFAVGGNIVNWIESKALFGDEDSHATYLKDQLYSYWNRFGPGLVIYWYGFIDEIQNVKKHGGILVCDDFPKNILKYNPSFGLEEMYADMLKPEEKKEKTVGKEDEEEEEDDSALSSATDDDDELKPLFSELSLDEESKRVEEGTLLREILDNDD